MLTAATDMVARFPRFANAWSRSARRSPLRALLVLALALSAIVQAAVAAHAETLQASRIPFVEGLTEIGAVSEPQGDYEALHTVLSIGKDGYRVSVSAQIPSSGNGKPQDLKVVRAVDNADKSHAHTIRTWFSPNDPLVFPGTVPGVSMEMLLELQSKGTTRVTYLDVGTIFGVSYIKRTLSGSLHRVGDGPRPLPMLVNGTMTSLHVIDARGTLHDAHGEELVEVTILAEPDNPMLLWFHGAGVDSRTIRIEYPTSDLGTASIESQLARNETVDIHSIYFAFNRADIRPESHRVLKEIADILHTHADWKLNIAGHTDAIGSDARNLALSQQRAAAVKAVLIDKWRINAARLTTVGYGETRPKDTNDTVEGRSHNRRVELSRR